MLPAAVAAAVKETHHPPDRLGQGDIRRKEIRHLPERDLHPERADHRSQEARQKGPVIYKPSLRYVEYLHGTRQVVIDIEDNIEESGSDKAGYQDAERHIYDVFFFYSVGRGGCGGEIDGQPKA